MKRSILLLLVLIAFVMKGCKSIEPMAPEESYLEVEDTLTQHISTVNLPIEFNLIQLERIVNSELGDLLFQDQTDYGSSAFAIKVFRRSAVSIDANDDQFHISVPIKVWAKIDYHLDDFGLSLSDTKQTEFELDLHYVTKLSYSPDWVVSTDTKGDGFDWIKKPMIRFAGINIPLSSFINQIIDNQQQQIAKEIDDQLKPNIDIKEYIRRAWITMQQPFQISEEYNVWLKVTPLDVLVSPLKGKGKQTKIMVGIRGYSETVIGEKPDAEIISMLPAFKRSNQINDEFVIGLHGEVSHSYINNLLEQHFQGKVFTFNNDKQKIRINRLELYGSQKNIVVKVEISGSISGKLFISGKPVYDPLRQAVVMNDLDFDLDTKNKLIKTASWLTKDKLLEEMDKMLTFPIKEQLNFAVNTIEQNLTHKEITPGIFLEGSLLELDPAGVYITQDKLNALILAKGKANVFIKEFTYQVKK